MQQKGISEIPHDFVFIGSKNALHRVYGMFMVSLS